MTEPVELAFGRTLGIRSVVSVPLAARGRTLGALTLASMQPGRYGDDDLELAVELGSRAAIAVDNSRLVLELQRAVSVREDLLAVVSHDLRNPLAAIGLAATGLLRRALAGGDERARRQLETVTRAASRMERLVGDLLDTANLEAGRLAVQLEAQPVGPLVDDALELHVPLALDKGVRLEPQVPDPGGRVLCDRVRVLQVLSNLLSNALKVSSAGQRIALRVERPPGADRIRFEIADEGPGIPPDLLPRIFDPYWSGPGQERRGTGLGLYISQGIVQLHGDTLRVDSRPGVGCRFSFTLPAAP